MKIACLHLLSQSVSPEVSCGQQAIPLIEAVWSQYFRVLDGWSARRLRMPVSGVTPRINHWPALYPVNRPSDSDLPHSAIHIDLHAGDVGRVLRSQKRHGPGHFLRLAKPLHRNFRKHFLGEFIEGLFR